MENELKKVQEEILKLNEIASGHSALKQPASKGNGSDKNKVVDDNQELEKAKLEKQKLLKIIQESNDTIIK